MKTYKKTWKRWLAMFCTVVMLFVTVPIGDSYGQVEAASTATTTDYLYLRTGPSTSYDKILLMDKGAVVTLIDNSDDEWAKVKTSSGKTGWCSKTYLSFGSSSQNGGTATTTDVLNMRSGAGTSYSVLQVLPKGTKLTVVDSTSNSGWVKVKTSSGKTGWCSRQYLSLSTASATPTLSVSPTSKTVQAGSSFTLTVTATNNSGKVPSISSSATSVATASYSKTSNGKYLYTIKGVKAGSATITVKVGSTSKTMKVTVTSASSSTSSGDTATTTDVLNMRSGAGTSYSVLQVLPKGTKLTVVDGTSNSGWVKVKTSSGKTGWCSREYLSFSSSSSSSSSSGGTATTTDVLNMRSGAGTSYSVLQVLPKGTKLTVVDSTSNSGWVKVKTSSGKTGWCSREYLSFSSSSTATPTLSLSPTSKTVEAGESFTLTVTATNNGSTIPSISSSSKTVATASYSKRSNGKYLYTIKGVKAGSATITVKVGSVSKTMKVTVTESTGTGETATTTDVLNMRSGPGTSYTVLQVLPEGTKLTVVDSTSNSGWVKVKTSSGTTGWCSREYLKLSSSTATPTLSLSPTSKTVEVGESFTLTVTATNNGSTVPSISSSATSVATASYSKTSNGKYLYTIKGVKAGSATITVKVGSVSKTMKVTVQEKENDEYPYARTTTAVNLRQGPGTTYTVITTMAMGTALNVLDTSNAEWTKVSIYGSSTTGYVSTEYIQFLSELPSGDITLSHTSASIPAGKTMYTTATSSNSGAVITWTSSNEKVATVQNGYIYAVAPGSCTITAQSGSSKQTCKVTVTAAEAVEFAYSDPNIAFAGSDVTLTAITNNQRTKVRFAVTANGKTTQYDVSGYTTEKAVTSGLADHETRVFAKKLSFDKAGTYEVKVYAYSNGAWSSDYTSFTVYVVSTADATTTSTETRRISDEMLTIISKMEGFSAGVYPDTLAYNIPTLGYGYVVSKGEKFYNNLTKREAWALLCNTINTRSYTSEVNKFIANNNLKVSQSQFDSLVSFSYNVGSGYWNNASASISMREIMLNAVKPISIGSSGRKGTSTESFVLYKGAGNNTGVITSVGTNTSVTVYKMEYQESTKQMWYYLKTSSGKTGWAHGGYISLSGSDLVHDLQYTDSYCYGTAMLEWHKAGGVCLPGLLYRRLAESKVYSFANYAEADPSSSKYKVNTYGYTYPGCLAAYEK